MKVFFDSYHREWDICVVKLAVSERCQCLVAYAFFFFSLSFSFSPFPSILPLTIYHLPHRLGFSLEKSERKREKEVVGDRQVARIRDL